MQVNRFIKRIRFPVHVFLLCVLCVFVVNSSWAATPREELLRLVPDSVGFCLVLQDLRNRAADLQSSPFVEQLRQCPIAVKIRNSEKWKKIDDVDSEMKEKLGLDWKGLRDDIFGDAVVLAYRPGLPGQPQQEQGVMLLRARNEKVLADLIERINKVQTEEGELKELTQRRHNGIVYYRRLESDKRTDSQKPPTFYYVHGPILAVSEQEGLLQQIIDRDTRSANGTEAERRLHELNAERALLAMWLNPRAFDAEVDAKVANAPAERSATVKHFAAYWKALESVVISLSPQDRDINLSLGVRARTAELPPAARRLFREAAKASDIWRRLPQSTLVSIGGRLDGVALLDVLGGFLTPQGQKALHATLNRPFASLLSEEDFTANLLPTLGPDWGLCLSAPSTGGSGSQAAREDQAMPHLLFALRLDSKRSKQTADRTLLAALDFAARFVIFAHNNEHPDAPLALKTVAVHGQEVRCLSGEQGLPAGVQPAYGLLDGYLVLTSSLESMKRFAESSSKPVPSAEVPVPLLRISFTDWRSYLTVYRQPIVRFLADRDKLSREDAGKQVDGLLTALQFVERAELNQRSSAGQIIFTLTIQTAQPLKK